MKFIISILFGVSMIMSTSSCTNHRADPKILYSRSSQDTYNIMDTARSVCDTFSTVKAVTDKNSRKISVNKMEIPTDVYYMMETDASGFQYSYPRLDTIPNLSKLIIREVWAQDRDSIKFEMILSLYMDNTYPNDKICSELYKRIDQHIIDGLSYDTIEEDSMLWHKNKPYLSTRVCDYKNAWRNVINKLSQKYVCLGRKTKYTQILDTYIFVLCHCIYEDENVITYIIESGNSFHGGCGCRNIADYLTFNKSNGHLLTKEEVINGVPKRLVNEKIHSAFIGSADLKGFPVDNNRQIACFENANGAAVVSGGSLFYYYPYTIGCGAEGQYNLLIPNLSSSIKQ